MLSLRAMLQRFADTDFADDVVTLAVKGIQRRPGFCFGAIFQLGELETALAVEFVLDDVFGRLSHGHTCQCA
jgi:hypothetical protein